MIRNILSAKGSAIHTLAGRYQYQIYLFSIIGYFGSNAAAPVLVQGLEKMEYRGFDSLGVAILYRNKIEARKKFGRVAEVGQALAVDSMPGKIGSVTLPGHLKGAYRGRMRIRTFPTLAKLPSFITE